MIFGLDDYQREKLYKWLDEVEKRAYEKQATSGGPDDTFSQQNKTPYYGAIGGGLTYSFTPTGLGVVVVVKEAITGEEINLTDYENW